MHVVAVQIAGAAAVAGLSLEEVRAVADEAAQFTGSMGVAMQICRIPGKVPPRGCDFTFAGQTGHMKMLSACLISFFLRRLTTLFDPGNAHSSMQGRQEACAYQVS